MGAHWETSQEGLGPGTRLQRASSAGLSEQALAWGVVQGQLSWHNLKGLARCGHHSGYSVKAGCGSRVAFTRAWD